MAAGGGQDLQLIQNSDITYKATSMDMYLPNSAPAATLLGCTVRAPLLNDGDITVGPGSTYMLFDGTGMSFQGDLHVNGFLSKSGGAFKIDHPLDPVHKYLAHSFVESPEMMNIYNGIATLGPNGAAIVRLPAYFEALNRDFRYQLTSIGSFAPVYVDKPIRNNSFVIAGGKPGAKISWQVTGVRRDPYANSHRLKVEEEKPSRTNESDNQGHNLPIEIQQK